MHESSTFETIAKLFAIAFLVMLNGFFVAAEFAIVKVRGTKIQSLVRQGSKRAKMAHHIISHLDAYLSATQLGITIASILLGWVGESTMRHAVVEPVLGALGVESAKVIAVTSFILGTGIIVFLHVVLGELAPKSLAIQRSEATVLWVAYPMKWFYVVMFPLIAGLNNTANFFLRMIGIHPAGEHEVAHSEEELRLLFAESQKLGVLTSDKRDLLENVFDLSRRVVRQIMVPRTEVAAFNLQKSLAENLRMAEKTAHSRYPVIDGDLDHVVGVIHMKDLFWQLKEMEAGQLPDVQNGEGRNRMIAGGEISLSKVGSGAGFLKAIARDVPFVPDAMRIDNLLREFQQKRVHLAMVVDEYGGTLGLVTFENVIEEIVGEVQDEFDEESPRIKKVNENTFTIDGVALLLEVNDAMGTSITDEDVDTIGGLVLNRLGRVPKPGDHVRIDGLEVTVSEMRGNRIHRVQAMVVPEEAAVADGTQPPARES